MAFPERSCHTCDSWVVSRPRFWDNGDYMGFDVLGEPEVLPIG